MSENSSSKGWLRASFLPIAYSLLVGLTGLAALADRWSRPPDDPAWLTLLIFAILSFLIQRSSFHLSSPIVRSLAGVIDLAAVLALGPASGAAVAALSGSAYLVLNALRRRQLGAYRLIQLPLFVAGLKSWIALLVGALLSALNPALFSSQGLARTPNAEIGVAALLTGVACLVWFVLDHIGWGILDYFEGGIEQLRVFIQDTIPRALYVELLPLPFSLVVALVYLHLGWIAFSLVAVGIVAVAVLAQRWATARQELEQRVEELSTLEQVGQAIAMAQLDVDAICQLIYEHAHRIMDTTIFHLGLFEGQEYTLRLWVNQGREQLLRSFHLSPGVGLVNYLRETKEPILVRDFEKEFDSLPAKPVYTAEHPPRSALFVPLMMGEEVVGTLSVQSFQPNAYGVSETRILSAMGNQAAMALQKALLYENTRKRARQLETIEEVSRQVAALIELDQVFKGVVDLIRENFDYYYVTIYTTDARRRQISFQASSKADQQQVAEEVGWGQGLIGWVAEQGQSVTVNDVENDTRYRCVEALEETRSEMAVPLLLDGEPVGVLDVQSDQVDAFGSDDLFILETLGQQVALAIQKARLYEAERQQAWLSTALLQVAEVANRVSDMDDVLATIVRLVPLLVGVDRCAVLLYEPSVGLFLPAKTYGLDPEMRASFEGRQFRPEEMPVLAQMEAAPAPIVVNVERDPHLVAPSLAQEFQMREMVFLPLLAQGELLGVILVDYAGQAHAFSDRMIEMLSGMANQASTVIHNARLVQAQQEEAYASMALLQVADAINRAPDLAEALAAIARITPLLLGVEACAFLLWEPKADLFEPHAQYGFREERLAAFEALRLTREASPARDLLAGASYVLFDGNTPTGEEPTGLIDIAEGNLLLALPMWTKGELVGMMLADCSAAESHRLSRWMSILGGIAGQAAIAVENDFLLQEAAEQERMKQELEVARRIQTSFLPDRAPTTPGWDLAAIWRSARQVGGDFYDLFLLPPNQPEGLPRTGIVVADVADKGVPAALFMALSRSLLRTVAMDGRSPDRTIARVNDLIVADARSNLFVTLFYAVLESDSRQMTYVNAGHMPTLLFRRSDGALQDLRSGGMALGVLPDIEFEQRVVQLQDGDTLVFYTDGVIEASNAQQEMFGRERLIRTVRACQGQSAQEIAAAVDQALIQFVGDAPQFDDLTLVVANCCVGPVPSDGSKSYVEGRCVNP